MTLAASQLTLVTLFLVLTGSLPFRNWRAVPRPVAIYLPYLWAFFLAFVLMEVVSVALGVWALAALAFVALREYFTLVDLRLQDRWGVLAAYAAIPFMFYYIQIDWYGMFIIAIPVYAFLVVPFLIALGGEEARGAVFSVGAIGLGLILVVFSLGHIGYLARYGTWMAAYVVMAVALCDLVSYIVRARDRRPLVSAGLQLLAPAPVTVGLGLILAPWTEIPTPHSWTLGLMIPALVAVGCHTVDHLEADLGIQRDQLRPGSGQVLNSLKSFMYAGPVALHYLRYSLDAF